MDSWCGMPFGDKDTGGVTGLGRSDDRTEVVRIFDTIEYNDERLLSFEERIEICIGKRRRDRDNALMKCTVRHAIQHGTLFLSNRNVALARQLKDFLQLARARFPRNVDSLDRHLV